MEIKSACITAVHGDEVVTEVQHSKFRPNRPDLAVEGKKCTTLKNTIVNWIAI